MSRSLTAEILSLNFVLRDWNINEKVSNIYADEKHSLIYLLFDLH